MRQNLHTYIATNYENIYGWLVGNISHNYVIGCVLYECGSILTTLAYLIHSQALLEMDATVCVYIDARVPVVSKVATLGNVSVPPDYAQSHPDSIKVCFWVSQLVWPISVKFGDRSAEELGQSLCNY